jgi:hypothetical protein
VKKLRLGKQQKIVAVEMSLLFPILPAHDERKIMEKREGREILRKTKEIGNQANLEEERRSRETRGT